ncbi:hypothetical protein JXJ21_26610 [candidate division KSB1 bacterium]|nr:hypothetical protein [candidate division KSB1 bacterium]
MDCLRNLKELCARIGEDINSAKCRELKAHLEQCPTCCAYVDSVKKTIFLYQLLEDEKDVPESIDKRLWKVLNLKCPENS